MSAAQNAAAETGAFSARVMVALVVVGVIAFAAFLVLSAYAEEFREDRSGGTHALSRSSIGFAGLVDLLERRGVNAVIARGDMGDFSDADPRILTPAYPVAEDERPEAWEPVLVVLPKWATIRHRRPGWVRTTSLRNARGVESILAGFTLSEDDDAFDLSAALEHIQDAREAEDDAEAEERDDTAQGEEQAREHAQEEAARQRIRVTRTEGEGALTLTPTAQAADTPFAGLPVLRTGVIEARQALTPPVDDPDALIPILVAGDGGVMLGQLRGTNTFVLSEPDLMNTHGIADPDTAFFAVTLIETWTGGAPVLFDVTLHGFQRTRNLLRLMFEPPFLPLVLGLVFAGALIGWRGGVRVSPPRRQGRVYAFGKTTLIDSITGLVRATGRELRLGPAYAALTRAIATETVWGRARAGLVSDEALNRLGDDAQPDFSTLRRAVEDARDPYELVDAARALHAWRKGVARE